MNTNINIAVVKQPQDSTIRISDQIEAAYSEFDRIVDKFTRFNESSQLSNLNRRGGKWTKVTEEMYFLVEEMIKLSHLSDGAFDPTVIDFLEVYGYDKDYDFSKLDNPELDNLVQKVASERADWREIKLRQHDKSIYLHPKQRIDLGGVGKGYAIDLAFEKLSEFDNFIIDAGGDVRAKGTNQHGKPWKIGLKHKHEDGTKELFVGQIESENIALACSGSWARKVKQFHHLISPSTGKPVGDIRTVYVTAPSALQADGWATAIFSGGEKLLNKLPEGTHAIIIFSDGKIIDTKGYLKA